MMAFVNIMHDNIYKIDWFCISVDNSCRYFRSPKFTYLDLMLTAFSFQPDIDNG